MTFKRLCAALTIAAMAVGTAAATDLEGTLKKIRDTNTITIGYRESSVPFSYLGTDGKPMGYAFEVCRAVGEAVKKELNLKDLKIRYQPVTSANRVPLIQNGTVDIECGSTTNSLVRQREAAFGINYFGIQVSAAVKKASGIKTLRDLDGRNVAVTAGTTSVALLKNFAKKEGIRVRFLMTKDFAEAMQLVVNGRADAFVIDDVLLAGQIANLDHPEDYEILDASLSREPYAAMFRKDDPAFKALVDRTITEMFTSGRMTELYKAWFESPIPPKNVNLNFPMNTFTKELFATPNDKGI